MAEEKKKRGRPKKITPELVKEIINEQTEVLESLMAHDAGEKTIDTSSVEQKLPDIQTQIVETIREIIVEKVVEVERPPLSGYALYRALRNAGFPQGGVGSYIEDPNGTDRVYVPHVSEVYTQFLADPQQWEALRDAICREWIKNQG